MIESVLQVYAFGLGHARKLVADVPDASMTRQAGGVVNHPAWSLGHLASSAQQLAAELGLERQLSEEWCSRFDAGTTPQPDAAAYPARAELLAALAAQHARVEQALRELDPGRWSEPRGPAGTPFPTLGALAVFLTGAHEWAHLGQIAAWRRAVGLGPA